MMQTYITQLLIVLFFIQIQYACESTSEEVLVRVDASMSMVQISVKDSLVREYIEDIGNFTQVLDVEMVDTQAVDAQVVDAQVVDAQVVDAQVVEIACDPLVGCESPATACIGDPQSHCISGIDQDCSTRCVEKIVSPNCRQFTSCEARTVVACNSSARWTTLVCERDQRCVNYGECETLPSVYGEVCNIENTRELCEESGLACGGWAIVVKCLHPDIVSSSGRTGAECYGDQDCFIGYRCSRAGYCIEGVAGDHCLEDEDCIGSCLDHRLCIDH